MSLAIARDLPASWIGAPAAAGLLIGSPPRVLRQRDEDGRLFDINAVRKLVPFDQDYPRIGLTANIGLRIGVCTRALPAGQ